MSDRILASQRDIPPVYQAKHILVNMVRNCILRIDRKGINDYVFIGI